MKTLLLLCCASVALAPTIGVSPLGRPTMMMRIVAVAMEYGVPPDVALGTAWRESGMRANATTTMNWNGSTNRGLFQLNDCCFRLKRITDPDESMRAVMPFLAKLWKQCRGDRQAISWAYRSGRPCR